MGKHSIWLHNVNNLFEDWDLCVYLTYLDMHFKRILKCFSNQKQWLLLHSLLA